MNKTMTKPLVRLLLISCHFMLNMLKTAVFNKERISESAGRFSEIVGEGRDTRVCSRRRRMLQCVVGEGLAPPVAFDNMPLTAE